MYKSILLGLSSLERCPYYRVERFHCTYMFEFSNFPFFSSSESELTAREFECRFL